MSSDETRSLDIARWVVNAKLTNQRVITQRQASTFSSGTPTAR